MENPVDTGSDTVTWISIGCPDWKLKKMLNIHRSTRYSDAMKKVNRRNLLKILESEDTFPFLSLFGFTNIIRSSHRYNPTDVCHKNREDWLMGEFHVRYEIYVILVPPIFEYATKKNKLWTGIIIFFFYRRQF